MHPRRRNGLVEKLEEKTGVFSLLSWLLYIVSTSCNVHLIFYIVRHAVDTMRHAKYYSHDVASTMQNALCTIHDVRMHSVRYIVYDAWYSIDYAECTLYLIFDMMHSAWCRIDHVRCIAYNAWCRMSHVTYLLSEARMYEILYSTLYSIAYSASSCNTIQYFTILE